MKIAQSYPKTQRHVPEHSSLPASTSEPTQNQLTCDQYRRPALSRTVSAHSGSPSQRSAFTAILSPYSILIDCAFTQKPQANSATTASFYTPPTLLLIPRLQSNATESAILAASYIVTSKSCEV